MAKTVTIGCKLPHGLIIEHPMKPEIKITLNGLKDIRIIGNDHATTEIDGDVWDAWKLVHKDFPALKNGAIFEAKSTADAVAVARELESEKTGLEPMPQKALGVEKSD